MTRRIRERVEDSFDDGDQEVRQYLDWLRAALSDLSGSLRRTVTFQILLMAIFEFVYESPHGTFTLAGFRIDRSSLVLQFIPVLVAFLYLQSIVDSVRSAQMQEALRRAFNRWSRRAGANDLDAYILPAYPLFWNPGNVEPKVENRLKTYRTYKAISALFLVVVAIVTIGYEFQAYYVLFRWRSPGNLYLWLFSLAMTFICLSGAFLYFTLDFSDKWRGEDSERPATERLTQA